MMIVVCTVILAIIVMSIAVYLLADYGEYNNLKPGYFCFYRMHLVDITEAVYTNLCRASFRVSNGNRLYHPTNRPRNFFKKGEMVYFYNIQKTWPYYGGDMGLAIEGMPEGVIVGTVIESHQECGYSVVTVKSGRHELRIYSDARLFMHDWESTLLRENPFLKEFYCLGLDETDKKFKKALKVAPLYY